MAKCNDADDAVNAAIPGIISICAVVDVVFGRDGGITLGDIHGFTAMVVQDTNATEPVAPVGFKYRKVMRVGPNGMALNQNERVRIASSVLNVDDAETFVGHGIGLALGPAICCGFF